MNDERARVRRAALKVSLFGVIVIGVPLLVLCGAVALISAVVPR